MKSICFLLLPLLPLTSLYSGDREDSVKAAYRADDFEKVIEITTDDETDPEMISIRAASFQGRGVERFFRAEIEGSIEDFDQFLKSFPEREPHHWQRGISYYYAGEYQKGVDQFEIHQTVNSQDVENAVWHFICAVRTPEGNFETAQKNLIPITADLRIPMKEVHELFAGRGDVESVLTAAGADQVTDTESVRDPLRNQLCYAHLYLALYFEAKGDADSAAKHIRLAAGPYRMDHYMGMVAQVHAKLRGVEIE